MAATAKKGAISKTATSGLATLVRDGNWDFGTIFNTAIEKMTEEQLTGAWLLVDLMEEVTKDRKADLRAALFLECEKRGKCDEKGSYLIEVNGIPVKREKRQSKLPEEDGLKVLLDKYRVRHDDCFDRVEYMTLNVAKLESLVETGKLPASEVEALKKTTWALKIDPDDVTEKDLEQIRARLGKAKPAKKLKG